MSYIVDSIHYTKSDPHASGAKGKSSAGSRFLFELGPEREKTRLARFVARLSTSLFCSPKEKKECTSHHQTCCFSILRPAHQHHPPFSLSLSLSLAAAWTSFSSDRRPSCFYVLPLKSTTSLFSSPQKRQPYSTVRAVCACRSLLPSPSFATWERRFF